MTRLNADSNAWLAEPQTLEQFRSQGMQPAPATPEVFGALVRQDFDRWAKVIRETGITAD